ncbi:MAG: hypothetical protein G01um101430_373 [Parcubacteria group bacterium Gr01-1014_30]|nr:MAG: hypothetical protein G01um101430_373 [Parcubacteria group bacterium Gr01-1014_30]
MNQEKRRPDIAIVQTYPAVGEAFELTIDFDAPENQPLEMLKRDSYNPEGWNYTGKKVTGKHTRRFKLVQVGYSVTFAPFAEVRQKIVSHGEVPEGQWRQAFKATYPIHDGKGAVNVLDSSWVDSNGEARFPYIETLGLSSFSLTRRIFTEQCRYLVAIHE